MTRLRPEDQPLPTPGRENVQDALIEDIAARRRLGVQRYGSPLQTFNGRDALRDLQEELLDAATYVKQARMERDELGDLLGDMWGLICNAGVNMRLHPYDGWSRESAEWEEAAKRLRLRYHAFLDSKPKNV